ncbi:LPXTG cell wall anchor domain-containing protein [Streptacidiphilus sp. N1-3]|uniref:LPXTG cell wall anchor domain-containing protein n=1 Tax=Streptacidiphilus alkalitolerans TaxID=3342712 RepID=A0ABV6XAA0_9ACTN
MGRIHIRRSAAAAVAVLTATTGLFVGLTVAPATAAGARFLVEPDFGRTVPVRADGNGAAYRPLDVYFEAFGHELLGVKVAVDGSALKGFAELALPRGCAYTTDHLHELCSLGDSPSGFGTFAVGVRATVGAVAGRHGDVRFKVTARNATEQSSGAADSVGVTVGDGPDLAINDLGDEIKAPAGSTTALPLQVTNVGSSDAKGVSVFVHDEYQIATVPGDFSNCSYETYAGARRGVICTFPDAVVKPGETFVLSTPLAVTVPAGGHADAVYYGVGTLADGATGEGDWAKGTGGVLSLVKAVRPQGKAAVPDPGTDIDDRNNRYTTGLDTGIVADASGVGGTLNGTVGKVGKAIVGVRNTGTVTLSTLRQVGDPGEGTAAVYVSFPAEVAVTSVPSACKTADAGPEGLAASGDGVPHPYVCVTRQVLKPGQQMVFTFGIKPLKVLSRAYAGVVVLAAEDNGANYDNNVAKLYINAAKAGAKPTTPAPSSGSGAATATASASASSGGGSLAATGGGSDTTPMMLAGAAAIVLGAGAVVVVRRRRVGEHG